MGTTFIDGHSRKTLYSNTALSYTGSTGGALGVFYCAQYSRLAGFVTNISSVTLRYQLGVDSSAFQVSSSIVINSGGAVVDLLNYGNHVNLSFSQAASQTGIAVLIYGEPLR